MRMLVIPLVLLLLPHSHLSLVSSISSALTFWIYFSLQPHIPFQSNVLSSGTVSLLVFYSGHATTILFQEGNFISLALIMLTTKEQCKSEMINMLNILIWSLHNVQANCGTSLGTKNADTCFKSSTHYFPYLVQCNSCCTTLPKR